VELSLQGELGRLTTPEGGQRNPFCKFGFSLAILHLLGGWILGVREGGDTRGAMDIGMPLLCPGSDILRLNESFNESRL